MGMSNLVWLTSPPTNHNNCAKGMNETDGNQMFAISAQLSNNQLDCSHDRLPGMRHRPDPFKNKNVQVAFRNLSKPSMPQALHLYSTPPPTGWYATQANDLPRSCFWRRSACPLVLTSFPYSYLFVLRGTAHDTRTGSSWPFLSSIAAIPLNIRVKRPGST
jgi:hypothetical protein